MNTKFYFLGVVASLGLSVTPRVAFNFPARFEDYFAKRKEIHLSTFGLRIGYMWSFAADDDGRLFFLDARGCQLIVFGNDGRFINRIGGRGQGPGEYMVPRTVFLDASQRIYVVDSQARRINTYDPGGKFLQSFLLANSHGPGDIVADSRANIFLGGLGLPASPGARGDWLQKYDSQGHFVRSFYKDISGKNWVLRMNPNFIFSIDEDMIYAMQINRYDIQVFNPLRGNPRT